MAIYYTVNRRSKYHDYESKEDVVNYIDKAYTDKSFTFKVETRRARKNYPKESMEINCDIGEVLLKAFPQMKVDVHKPDVMLHIEIREKINIYSKLLHLEIFQDFI